MPRSDKVKAQEKWSEFFVNFSQETVKLTIHFLWKLSWTAVSGERQSLWKQIKYQSDISNLSLLSLEILSGTSCWRLHVGFSFSTVLGEFAPQMCELIQPSGLSGLHTAYKTGFLWHFGVSDDLCSFLIHRLGGRKFKMICGAGDCG